MTEPQPLDESTRERIRSGIIDVSARARTALFGLIVLCLFALVSASGLPHARRLAHATRANLDFSNSLRLRAEKALDEALIEPVDEPERARRAEALRRAEVREARAWDLARHHSLSAGDTDANVPVFGVSLGATELFLALPLLLLLAFLYVRGLLRTLDEGLAALRPELERLPPELRPLVTSAWLGTLDPRASLRSRLFAWVALDLVAPLTLVVLGLLLLRAFPFEAHDMAPLELTHWVAWGLYVVSTVAAVIVGLLATLARWRRRSRV